MKRSLSPEELDRICFEIQRVMSQADDLTKNLKHLLEQIGDSELGKYLQEEIYSVRDIASTALERELYNLLYELRRDLTQQGLVEADMRIVYASPEFMSRIIEQPERITLEQQKYPGNYSERSSGEEGGNSADPAVSDGEGVRPANWEEGDTVGFCPKCKNVIPRKSEQCPYCGAKLRKGPIQKPSSDEDGLDAAYMGSVYASPSVMRIRPAQALISRIREKLSKRGK